MKRIYATRFLIAYVCLTGAAFILRSIAGASSDPI